MDENDPARFRPLFEGNAVSDSAGEGGCWESGVPGSTVVDSPSCMTSDEQRCS